MKTQMNLLVHHFLIVILLTFLLFFGSCAKDSDLFQYAIEEEIAENIEETENEGETAEEETEDSSESDETIEESSEDTIEEENPDFEDTTDRSSPLKAFPSAEGFGKNATGGRGGYVYEVTNLNDSGPGSLRAGIESSGSRTIIFKVCGNINLSNVLIIRNPDITIAGQTAPGDGISIVGNGIFIEASNVIIRNIRVRRYSSSGFSVNAINIGSFSGDVENVILDHVSVNWGADENFVIANAGTSYNTPNSYYVSNVTIQNSISSQNSHLTLISSGCRQLTMFNNYFAFGNDRAPLVSTPFDVDEITDYLRVEFINNVIYAVPSIGPITYGLKSSFIGNFYKLANGQNPTEFKYVFTTAGENSSQRNSTEIYLRDNYTNVGLMTEDSNIESFKRQSPYNSSGILDLNPNNLAELLLPNVGTLPHDFNDSEIISRFFTGEYAPIIGSAVSDGFYEYEIDLNCSESAYFDNDGDGMEDAWEINRGLDPSVPDNNGDDDGDGYTNLEEYLNYLLP